MDHKNHYSDIQQKYRLYIGHVVMEQQRGTPTTYPKE